MHPTKRPRFPRPVRAAVLTLACCALAVAPRVLADGKVFPARAYPAEVRIPDQTALICWSNGVERLVIETRFEGQGTNFAWVVPLPAVPVIEPATPGLFVTLRHQLQPEIIHDVDANWGFLLFGGALVWLVLTIKAGESGLLIDTLACALGGVGLAAGSGMWFVGVAMFVVLWVGAFQVRVRSQPIYMTLATAVIMFLLAGMLLPALGTAKGSVLTGSDGVEVLEQQRVGVYDTATVSASDPQALPRWLEENGFALTPGSAPIIEAYARDGWVFVAAKAQRHSEETTVSALHPLSFTFPAKEPVYPLRLTAVGNESVEVDLFVLGAGRAGAKGFEVTECRPVDRTPPDGFLWQNRGDFQLGHPSLRAWSPQADVVTRLHGVLDAAAMKQDAVLKWEPYQTTRTRFYSVRGARTEGLNRGVPVIVCWLLLLAAWSRRRKRPLSAITRPALVGTLVGLVVVLTVFFSLPRISVRLEKRWAFHSQSYLRDLAVVAALELEEKEVPTLDELRKALAGYLPDLPERERDNLFLGGQIREEDSPGNYTLRETEIGIEMLGHAAAGNPSIVARWSTNGFKREPDDRP